MAIDDEAGELGGISLRRPDEGDVDHSLDQRPHLWKHFHAVELQFNVWIFLMKGGDQFRQQADGARRQYIADGDGTDVAARGAFSDTLCIIGLSQCGARFFQEALSGLRERYGAFPPAREQPCAEHRLKSLDLVAEGRGRNIELLCRPREMQFFGDRYEVPKMAQFHCADVLDSVRGWWTPRQPSMKETTMSCFVLNGTD